MFNLLVSGNGEWWETPPFSMYTDRFKEYSGVESDAIALDKPKSLRQLEEIPTLLMYEVGAGGPNARLVRHGRIKNLARQGSELIFDFDPDDEKAYLDRGDILSFSDQLGMHRLERYRTHWAIKDGSLPPGLLEIAVGERPQRTVAVIAAEYIEAKNERRRNEASELEDELEAFPPSLEKAMSLLPAQLLKEAAPEIYAAQGIKSGSSSGRAAVKEVLQRDYLKDPKWDWSFSVAWFLDEYGSPTEARSRDEAVEACRLSLNNLSAPPDIANAPYSIDSIATALWRCARSLLLVGQLRREIATLVAILASLQELDGAWAKQASSSSTATIRGTALATVALQRLGDDRHHAATEKSVAWLIEHWNSDNGGWPRYPNEDSCDVVATVMALEAIRRSNLVNSVPHVLTAGEAWLVSAQTVLGTWKAEPWPESFLVAVVLDYLQRRGAMLPQVDGFLLMTREFFRRAEELRLEGGPNNRRMAAIATVHAMEMFLYGVFERREDLALSPFRENGVETLGPREALRALQDSLQRIGVLPPPRRLKHRDQLSSLIGRRDGIIHRAHEISGAELDEGLHHARRFIETYGAELINLDLLQ